MKNIFKVLSVRVFGIIALVAVIGFSFAACGDGGGGGGGDSLANQLSGTWKASDGEEITLNKDGSFVISENNKQSMRGTYTAAARSVSATVTMAIKELHGDFLTENNDNGVTFESKWYNKNQVIDFFKNFLKTSGMTDAEISAFITENSADFNAMFPTMTGTVNDNTMTFEDGSTFTKNGGSTNPGTNPGTGGSSGGWTAVADSKFNADERIDAIAWGNNMFVAGSSGYNGKIVYSPDGVNWTAVTNRTFPDSIDGIVFGGGKFIAVDSQSQTATSTDGITWTAGSKVSNSSFHLEGTAYGNGMFVVVGQQGKIAYSSDGVTWTPVTDSKFDTSIIHAIAYGGNKFVAVSGYPGIIAYSSDNGVTWTATEDRPFGTDGSNAIAYGNGKFVAGGDYGKMAYSSDGVNWTAVTNSTFGDQHIYAITYANNKFVAAGTTGKIATSTDGVTWTAVTTNVLDYELIYNGNTYKTKYSIFAIAYGNGKFVVGCEKGKIAYSTDGGTGGNTPQTATYTGTSGGTAYTLKITENTARYAAQNGDAYELTAGSKKSTGTVSSVSGGSLTLKPTNKTTTFTATVSGSSLTALNGTITWTDGTTATAPGAFTGGTDPGTGGNMTWTIVKDSTFHSYNHIKSIAYGNNKFVAVGNGAEMAYSTDGITWTAVGDSKFGENYIYSIAYGNDKFVAVGDRGKMSYSSDGITWTAVTNSTFGGSADIINTIAYGNNKFVAGSYYGKMAYSSDGITWTTVTNSTFGTTEINTITYDNNVFVAGGESGKMAYSSDNGVTWTAVANSTFGDNGIRAIAYGNGKFVAGGWDGKAATSTNGVTWTALTITAFSDEYKVTGITAISAIAYGNGKFVAVGDGRQATSTDGTTWTAGTINSSTNAIAYGNNTFVVVGNVGKILYSTGN